MSRPQVIDLNDLEIDHSAEISRMLAGIEGDLGGDLWTSQMRASVRGGKPLGLALLEDLPDSKRNE